MPLTGRLAINAGWETQGRLRGDSGETQGRLRGDSGETRGTELTPKKNVDSQEPRETPQTGTYPWDP